MLNIASVSLTSQRNNRDELEIDVHTHKITELACLVVAGLVHWIHSIHMEISTGNKADLSSFMSLIQHIQMKCKKTQQ